MSETEPTRRFIFPRWANYALPAIVVGVLGGALYVPIAVGLGFSPKTTAVGYAPEQPVPYSHAMHVGKLGLDCRYCHSTVEKAAFAAIPPTQVCMNCHTTIQGTSPPDPVTQKTMLIEPLRKSWESGKPVDWVKIHDLPDYAFFNHSAHVNRGVGCVSCHGRVDQMDVVHQVAPLSMSWCLDCHRAPENHLRPLDKITDMNWKPTDDPRVKAKGITDVVEAQKWLGAELKKQNGTFDSAYMTSCYTCHR